MTLAPFSCQCDRKKTHKLIFDGGVLGNYTVFQCHSCYLSQDKKFLISEEKIIE